MQHLDKTLAHPYLVGFSDAMDSVFLVGAFAVQKNTRDIQSAKPRFTDADSAPSVHE